MNPVQLEEIKGRVRHSVFNRDRYQVNVPLRRLARNLMLYVDDARVEEESVITMRDVFAYGVPAFQRDNDKWDHERQINFVENLITGYQPTIQLYTTQAEKDRTGGHARCWILDGLQRLTAIAQFMEDGLCVFDGKADYATLDGAKLMHSIYLNLEVFTFRDEVEAAEFYIQLNRGITHSSEDIRRAERFIAARQG